MLPTGEQEKFLGESTVFVQTVRTSAWILSVFKKLKQLIYDIE